MRSPTSSSPIESRTLLSKMPSSARCLRRQPLMRRGGGMRDEALGVAEIVADLEDLERIHEAERRRPCRPSPRRRPSARLLPSAAWRAPPADDRRGRDRTRARLPCARRENRRSPPPRRTCRSTRTGKVSRPFSSTQALNGLKDGPVCLRIIVQLLLDELLRPEHDAAEAAALAVDMFGRRIDDDVGAERHRPLQQRRGEHVVDHDERAGASCAIFDTPSMSTSSSTGLVGVSKKKARVLGLHRRFPGGEVAPVDQRRLDAVARQQILDDVAAAAEQRARRDHMIAGLEMAKQRRGDGGHAARRAARGVGAFERAHARLEHGDGRVGVAAIDVSPPRRP